MKSREKIISGIFWKSMERGGVQVVQFILSLILARLLTPEDYGVVGLITVFIAIANVLITSGFSLALIQKKRVDELDYSSVFYLTFLVSIIIYIILYYTSPFIAKFYEQPILVPILRVQSITILIGAIISIQNAILTRNMEFKKSFYRNLGATIIGGVIGLICAIKGFGIWALVFSNLLNSLASMTILGITVKWRPKLMFSISRIKELFNFGSRLLLSSLIDTLYNNIYPLIIGRLFSSSQIGLYNRGQQIPKIMVDNVNGSIMNVMFPVFAEVQDDRELLKCIVRKTITISSFVIFPIMIGLAAIAKPLTIILLTNKWIDSVPFMQLTCFSLMLYPIHTSNLQAINAMGRSDVFLKLEIIKKCIGIVILLISIPLGITAMIWGQVISSFIGTIINSYPNKKLLNYSFIQQWKDIAPSLFLSIGMGAVVLGINLIEMNIWVTLIVQIISGIVVYSIGAYIFKFEVIFYIKQILNRR